MSQHTKSASLLLLLVTASVLQHPISTAQQADRVTGLIKENGWQVVQANCTVCHSAQIITQNSGSRAVWKSRIVWMQETQGLGELSSDAENTILDYLVMNYGQKENSRRAEIPAHLMPDNPYNN